MSILAWIGQNSIRIFAWLAEFLAVLFCVHGMFAKRLRIRPTIITMAGAVVIVFSLIEKGILPGIFMIITHVLTIIYAFRIFGKKRWETVCRYILGILAGAVIEIGITFVMKPVIYGSAYEELLAEVRKRSMILPIK